MEKEEYRKLFELEDHLWWFLGMRDISLALLERFRPDIGSLTILDVGCGTGGMLETLSRFGSTVGIDISADALRLAESRRGSHLVRATVSDIPFAGATFHLVTSFDVIYHRAVVDDGKALAEIARVLRPGGLVLVRVPAYDWLRGRHDDAVHTRHRYVRVELEEKLRGAGLTPLYSTYANCLLFPLALTKRLMERLLPRSTRSSDVEPLAAPWNRILFTVLRAEASLLRWTRLPFGLSLIALARRPPPARPTPPTPAD